MALTVPISSTSAREESLRSMLDFPILFTKRGNYQGIHIYDTCYQWHPGGGIYILENPSDPPEKHRVHVVIDENSTNSLGRGMYFDPDLSFDAKKILFCFKGEPEGSSCIYEIGIDGAGLRQITNPRADYLPCEDGGIKSVYHGRHGSLGAAQDLTPAYLPDGRIVFTTMRHNGLVPCNNTGVAILHVMNPDGSDIHPISVNSETEFDPSIMIDGRILYGRWEYVDKTALTIQSLWTVYPSGTMETAVYANNMVFPEAVLDSRQVFSDPAYVVSTFSKHNSTPRGTIALIDTRIGKNDAGAVFNFSDPNNPLRDAGESCEPYPITKDLILLSDRNGEKNALFLIRRNEDDSLIRELVFSDPTIDCHSPIPVRQQQLAAVRPAQGDRSKDYGFFLLKDVYQGMPDVPRGSIKKLRVVEETSRVSPTPGPGPFNQTFTISAALAWTAKNYLGEVSVEEDGSAYFEAPAGKMLFFQALDAEGRCVRSMRTFIQAAPGITRGCIGCHENKKGTFLVEKTAIAQTKPPQQIKDESWGSGVLDYPTMIQPILDRHCVRCHGGEQGFAAGLDLTGGWTKYFNHSYENLVSRRELQYKATLIAGVCSMNGTAYYSAPIFPAYAIGSPAAPLAKVIVEGDLGHQGRFDMTRPERDLVLAWIDGNGPYHGTWNYTPRAFQLAEWQDTKKQLIAEMARAGCVQCHTTEGENGRFEPDWFNLKDPKISRILRAPLAKGKDGFGEALCRDAKVDSFRRLRIFSTGQYEHAVKPLDSFPKQVWREWDKGQDSGKPVISFENTEDRHYQNMLAIISKAREQVLANPRLDMPRGEVFAIAGRHRNIYPVRLPKEPPQITAEQIPGGEVAVRWGLTTHTWGLFANVYRGREPDFALSPETKIARTELGAFIDRSALPSRDHYYAVVFDNEKERSEPVRVSVKVSFASKLDKRITKSRGKQTQVAGGS
ncbi:MAG: HzsA-related protein [Planctomycetota bacterium]